MKDTMLLFDLDGTLWDSAEGVAISWNIAVDETLKGFKKFTADDIHNVMGRTMDEISQIFFSELDEETRHLVYEKCMLYENEYLTEHGGILFPGIRETLAALKEQGYDMAVVSNCQTGYIPAFLQSMDMKKYFVDYCEWGNTHMPKSYNINLVMERNGYKKGVYIGDTAKDGEAARKAGIPFVLAAYGFGNDDKYDACIDEFCRLPEAINTLMKA